MLTREQMINKITVYYGEDSEWTDWFLELEKDLSDSQLFDAFCILMSFAHYQSATDTDDYEIED